MSIDKKALRQQMIAQRNTLSAKEINRAAEAIFTHLAPLLADKKNIMMFMDMNNEVPVSRLPENYPDKTFYIPKVFPAGQMGISLYRPEDIQCDAKGLRESTSEVYYPLANIDFILVPGNVFDENKNRIGYGGGYYDRFLARANALNIAHVAVCYDFQIIDRLPEEKHDIKMQHIISEQRMI